MHRENHVEIRTPHRTRHSHTQSIHAEPDEVFPLLCPVREVDWVPGWLPDWVISESGRVETGCIFKTPGDPGGVAQPATWVVTRHDPRAHEVEMLKLVPDHSVTRLAVCLQRDPRGGTRATVTYELTALGPEGERFVDQWTGQRYREFMLGWEARMNEYLATAHERP